MGSLKSTITGAFRATFVWELVGDVEVMYGFVHSVVKDHGFGTAPGSSATPALSSPKTWTVCTVHCGKSVPWVRVRRVSPRLQPGASAITGAIVHVTDAVSIGSLKSTTMLLASSTSTSASAGAVWTIVGGTASVTNSHGFTTLGLFGFATSAFPSTSVASARRRPRGRPSSRAHPTPGPRDPC